MAAVLAAAPVRPEGRPVRGWAPRQALALAAAACLAWGWATPASAQGHRDPRDTAGWVEGGAVLGANALVGGAVAGVTALLRGDDAARAFVGGLAGGAVGWGAKALATRDVDGAGLAGRLAAGVGGSMVANAGAGRGLLDEVWLPVGPVWVRARGEGGLPVHVSLPELGILAWAATRDELELDAGTSLSLGTPVFRAPGHVLERDGPVGGVTLGGIVLTGISPLDPDVLLRHEIVHVLQYDMARRAVVAPLEAWAARRALGRALPASVGAADLLLLGFYEVAGGMVEGEAYWWEGT